MVRGQLPLGKPAMGDRTAYIAAYDELFIGLGRNVAENVFDQNRLGLLMGYRFNKTLRVEGVFFSANPATAPRSSEPESIPD